MRVFNLAAASKEFLSLVASFSFLSIFPRESFWLQSWKLGSFHLLFVSGLPLQSGLLCYRCNVAKTESSFCCVQTNPRIELNVGRWVLVYEHTGATVGMLCTKYALKVFETAKY